MDAYSSALLVVLVVALALLPFVTATEAGLTTISRARVRLMAGRGVPRAEILHSYVQERESILRALALAHDLALIAAAALGVGLLSRERGHGWEWIAAVVGGGLVLVAVLEALPRLVVARNPERWGLRLSPLMNAFRFVFGTPARLLNLPVWAVTRGREPDGDEEEEMLRLMELEETEGDLEEDERKMIRGVFGLEDTTVREIMTPRPDIVALPAEATLQDAVRLITEKGFSRIPVYETNVDSITGILYAKDLMRDLADGKRDTKLREICRQPFFVPDSKRVDDLLTDMRKQRVHMAVVVDEYGGTAGVATIEDLLEEIVGEIEDEYDRGEEPVLRVSEREALFDGRVSIDVLNDLFRTDIKSEDFDTVGGCVFHVLGKMPVVGDEAEADGVRLHVLSVEGHRIKRVRAVLEHPREEGEQNGRRPNGTA